MIVVGGFGLVVLVADMHTQKEMVLKRCNIDREEVFNIVKKEISILQRFTGPYITKMVENDVNFVNNRPDSREALLLLEYYPGGHLLHRLNQRQGSYLPAESIYRIFGQILMGVKVFHENNPPIINRDLKLENILFGTVSCRNNVYSPEFSCFFFHRMVKCVYVTLALVKSHRFLFAIKVRGRR